MDLNAVLDTCVVVDLLSGGQIPPLETGRYAVSVVTELELLSKPDTTPYDAPADGFIFELGAEALVDHALRQVYQRAGLDLDGQQQPGEESP